MDFKSIFNKISLTKIAFILILAKALYAPSWELAVMFLIISISYVHKRDIAQIKVKLNDQALKDVNTQIQALRSEVKESIQESKEAKDKVSKMALITGFQKKN